MTGRPSKPRMPGVSVYARRNKSGTLYVGRYTLASKERASLPARPTWSEAFDAAAEEQRKVNRHSYRDIRKGRMTFTELVDEHWWPQVAVTKSLNTQKNYRSHLGNVDGRVVRKGGKAARAARFYLRFVFGPRRLCEIGPEHVRAWQAAMLAARYEVGSICAKRAVLKGILELARVNGWIDLNPVDAVPEPTAIPKPDHDRVITPAEWGLLRSRLAGRATLLLVDVLLDAGARIGEATALRPKDVLGPDERNPPRIHICRNVTWPGRALTGTGVGWVINDYTKTRKDRTVAIRPDTYDALCSYIEWAGIAPDALIFDVTRIRAEHAIRRERDPLPQRFPHGRYVNERTGGTAAGSVDTG